MFLSSLKQGMKQLQDVISVLFRGSRKENNFSHISLQMFHFTIIWYGAQEMLMQVIFDSATYC